MYENTYRNLQHVPGEWTTVSECGYVWLDKPWVHTDARGKTTSTRVITWQPQAFRWNDESVTNGFGQVIGSKEVRTDGFRISTWSLTGDPSDYDRDETRKTTRDVLGPLTLLHTMCWPKEMRFGGHDSHDSGADTMAWVYCLWLMLDSEVTSHRREALNRPARRRAQRSAEPGGGQPGRSPGVQLADRGDGCARARHRPVARPGEGSGQAASGFRSALPARIVGTALCPRLAARQSRPSSTGPGSANPLALSGPS